MIHLRIALVLCAPCALTASAAPVQSVTNLGLSAVPTNEHGRARGDRVVFHVREDGVDQNGDGDANDAIAHVLTTSTGAVVSTGIAVSTFVGLTSTLGDRLCVVPAREASYGPAGTDLNGDGDVNDEVAHVYDPVTGTVTNLRVPISSVDVPTAGDHLLLRVHEGGVGADLNGDGDQAEFVVHAWRVGQTTAVNRGLAVNRNVVGRRGALFTVDEYSQNVDLNGDGDALDPQIVHAYDRATDTITNLGISALYLAGDREGGDLFAFAAFEAAHGAGADWNGDGDSDDLVLHAWIAPSATVRNLGLPVRAHLADAAWVQVAGSRIFFGANEAYQGSGTDWNADGDAGDLVLHVHETRSATTTNAGLAVPLGEAQFGPERLPIDGATIVVVVSEAAQGGADRNGDGDALDLVPAIHDARTGATTNLGLASQSTLGFSLSRRLLVFEADERAQGGLDQNGDGHVTPVAAAYERATGTLHVLPGPTGYFRTSVLGDTVVHAAPESLALADLNGDGDQNDQVLRSWSLVTGALTDHALAVESQGFVAAARNGILFRVRESDEGLDLNGDGDVSDRLVHVFRP